PWHASSLLEPRLGARDAMPPRGGRCWEGDPLWLDGVPASPTGSFFALGAQLLPRLPIRWKALYRGLAKRGGGNRRGVIDYIIKPFRVSPAGPSVVFDKNVPEVDASATPPLVAASATPPPRPLPSALVYPRWINGATDLAGFRAEADVVSGYAIQGPG